MFYSSFHESSNGASGWSLVLSLPQSPTQPLLSLLLPCVSLDIDNKIIIAVMRLVGLHSEVLVMSLHSMHIYIYMCVFSKEEHALVLQEVLLSNVFGQRCHKCLFSLLFSSTNK
jgi:hypothetical protein